MAQYYRSVLESRKQPPFEPGKTRINYSTYIFDQEEVCNLVEVALDYWLTAGKHTLEFERVMRAFFKTRDFVLVNSGSAANLLMVATLMAEELVKYLAPGDPLRPLTRGDEVITTALTFPTTLAPIVQCGLVPVFVDVRLDTLSPDPAWIEGAIGPKTKAVFLPHPLGFPFDLEAVTEICTRKNLWLLEDGCDALGATFDGKLVGTFGAMSSLSFYPAHHMTLGEGGGVVINHPRLTRTARSIRDWGRDCYCDPGKANTCGKRFGWDLGELPKGYDHKYIYSNIGYNLKATDMQAAVGCAQAAKIPFIVERRRANYAYLFSRLNGSQEHYNLVVPHPKANPSPYALPLTLTEAKGPSRAEVISRLEAAGIETRTVFSGNILRHPGYQGIPRRVPFDLANSDYLMTRAFFVGVHPYLREEEIDYMAAELLKAATI